MLTSLYNILTGLVALSIYMFVTDFIVRSSVVDFDSWSEDVENKLDNIIISTCVGLIIGPCIYSHRLSEMFNGRPYQILAFFAGAIAGIPLMMVDSYDYHKKRLEGKKHAK